MMSSRTLLTMVVAGMLVAGCSSAGSSDPGATVPVVARDSVEERVIGGSGFADKPAGLASRAFGGNDGALAGPHFALWVSWVATGPYILDNHPASVTPYKGIRADDGQEILAFSVNPEYRNGQWTIGDKPKPVAELVVGGNATKLANLPLPTAKDDRKGALVIASVPAGAEVRLRVTDREKAQSLDLRTGKRGDDAIAGYYRKNSKAVDVNKDLPAGIKVQSSHYPVKFILNYLSANIPASNVVLAPYTPTRGWAAQGRAWLLLPNPTATVSVGSGMPIMQLDADDPAMFRLRLADGSEIKALDGKHTYNTVAGIAASRGADVVFDAPADFTTGTFLVNLGAATITAQYSDMARPGTWSPAPPVTEIAVALS